MDSPICQTSAASPAKPGGLPCWARYDLPSQFFGHAGVVMPISVLLVEDSPADARIIQEAPRETGADRFALQRVERVSAVPQKLCEGKPDFVVLDLSLPDSKGLETFRRVKKTIPDLPVVVLTGLSDEEIGVQAVSEGAQDYLLKSELSGPLLARALRYALERRHTEEPA